jgi:hypothetical protein
MLIVQHDAQLSVSLLDALNNKYNTLTMFIDLTSFPTLTEY